MGAKAGITRNGESSREVERMDIRVCSAVLVIRESAAEIAILGSHNTITISQIASGFLGTLTVEGASNCVRLERDTHLVDILGTDNAVTVTKGVTVQRMRLQGEEVRWTTGKKDLGERGTEDGSEL